MNKVRMILISCLATAWSTGLIVAEKAPGTQPIFKADEAPVIDGKLDDSCWKKAKAVQAFFPHATKDVKTEPPPLNAWYAWDEHYLFIGYRANDSSLVALGTGKEDGPPENRRQQSVEYDPKRNLDLVEFFISFGSKRFFWEIHHNAANHLNDIWIEMPTAAELAKIEKPNYKHVGFRRERIVSDEKSFTVRRAVSLLPNADKKSSTINDESDVDTGYTGEIRLPWAGLGAPGKFRKPDGGFDMQGKRLIVLAVVLNGNGGEAKYHSSGENLPPLMYHFSLRKWPRYELTK